MNKTAPVFGGLVLFICLVYAPVSWAQSFNVSDKILENGLRVVVIPNNRAPVVTHMIWYKVGAADEPPGQSGMAHYFEHLMFKGTDKLPPGEFSKRVRTFGGQDNAFTSYDYTAYFQTLTPERLGDVMAMEADRMLNLKVPADHFKSEKAVVIEERNQRTENNPQALFSEQMRSTLYENHPYGTPVIGWMDEIQAHEWDNLKDFYRTWYRPDNAVLVISGAVEPEDAFKLAAEHYGALPFDNKAPALKRTRPAVPRGIAETHLQLEHPDIGQASYSAIAIAPSFSANKKDSLALQVLEDILSGGPTARLYKSLVVEQKVAVSAGMTYAPTGLDYGTIYLYSTPAADHPPAAVQGALDKELAKLIQDGVTEAEIARAIQRLQDGVIFAQDGINGPARLFGAALTTGSDIADIQSWPDDIAAVTKEDVQRVARTYLNKDEPYIRPRVTGFVFPEEKKETDTQSENIDEGAEE